MTLRPFTQASFQCYQEREYFRFLYMRLFPKCSFPQLLSLLMKERPWWNLSWIGQLQLGSMPSCCLILLICLHRSWVSCLNTGTVYFDVIIILINVGFSFPLLLWNELGGFSSFTMKWNTKNCFPPLSLEVKWNSPVISCDSGIF